MNGKTFSVQRYQGEHAGKFSMMEIVNNIPNGNAYLYDKNGILMMRWTMKNGKEDGVLRVYNKGKLSRKTEWSYFSKYNAQMPWFEFTLDGKEVMILEDMETGHTTYRGEFDNELNPHGYGIAYSRENGEVLKSGRYCKGKFISCHQKFEMEDGHPIMIEYDRNDLTLPPQPFQHPIYTGGYVYDRSKYEFVRDGKGTLYDKTNGLYMGVCEYRNGVEINSKEEEEARKSKMEFLTTEVNAIKQEMIALENMINEISTTTTTLLTNGLLAQQQVLSSVSSDIRKLQSGLSIMDTSISGISSEMSLLEESKTKNAMKVELCQGYEVMRGIEEIKVDKNRWKDNTITKLLICNLPRLKKVIIGFISFTHVRHFELSNCPNVQSLQVEEGSFNNVKSSGQINGNTGCCRIYGCSKLKTIEINDRAFWDYRELTIKGMERLLIKIGV